MKQQMINEMTLRFVSRSANEAFARAAAAAFVAQLDPTVEQVYDIKTAVSEAVTNAIKHGRATRLVLTSDTLPTADGFALRIINNGTPFDPNRALGPEAGHYGLSGMRERARRNGIEISWFSSSRITSVRLEVHL